MKTMADWIRKLLFASDFVNHAKKRWLQIRPVKQPEAASQHARILVSQNVCRTILTLVHDKRLATEVGEHFVGEKSACHGTVDAHAFKDSAFRHAVSKHLNATKLSFGKLRFLPTLMVA